MSEVSSGVRLRELADNLFQGIQATMPEWSILEGSGCVVTVRYLLLEAMHTVRDELIKTNCCSEAILAERKRCAGIARQYPGNQEAREAIAEAIEDPDAVADLIAGLTR